MNIKCAHSHIVRLSDLKPHPGNLNIHSQKQIEVLAKIIAQTGQRSPIVVSSLSGYITKGHGRLEAIKLLGWEQCAIDYQDYKDEIEEFKDRIADNEIARYAEFDREGFTMQLGELNLELNKIDFEEFGLIEFKLPEVEVVEGSGDPDDVPEVKKEARTVRGDIYELGEHRIMCGDSTMIDDVDKLMNGEKADILCWDPPWNVNFKYNSYEDNKSEEQYRNFLNDCIKNFIICAKTDYCCFVWQSEKNWKYFINWFGEYSPRIAAVAKNFVQPASCFINRAWDPVFCWHGKDYNEKNNINFRDFFLSNTANTKQTDDRIISGQHPCPRNVDAVEYFLKWKPENSLAIDLCLGSGTTLIACEKTKRRCFGIEIDPFYCDVIVTRYVKFTGNNKIKRNGKEIIWEL